MEPVRRAVILAAGLGTRLLPATKAVPKEMLPLVDRPVLQYAAEEAAAAGIAEIVIVTGPDRRAVREHFGGGTRLERHARRAGDDELLRRVTAIEDAAAFRFVEQDEPLGTADAVLRAEALVGDEPFALLFPDDVILGAESCTAQLARAREARGGGSAVAMRRVPRAELPRYGVADPEPGETGDAARLRGIVEKPAPEDAPSDLGVVGRYVLEPSIFQHLRALEPGAGGELQFTDALARQIAAGEPVFACRFEGRRHDTGQPAGLVAAAVDAALSRADTREATLAAIRPLMPPEGGRACAS